MSQVHLLQNLYLFKSLSESQMELIDGIAEQKVIPAGEKIFVEKDPATALYIIQFGSVRIHQTNSTGDIIEVAVLGTGSHFGEMAFIDGENRSASASAVEKSEIIEINYESLRSLLEGNSEIAIHFYRHFAHFLCGRLRVTTNDLSFSRTQNLSHF